MSIAIAGDGSLLVTGGFSLRADLDPGPEVDEHSALGETDTFVLRLPASSVLQSGAE
jgi:hypothetical protein